MVAWNSIGAGWGMTTRMRVLLKRERSFAIFWKGMAPSVAAT